MANNNDQHTTKLSSRNLGEGGTGGGGHPEVMGGTSQKGPKNQQETKPKTKQGGCEKKKTQKKNQKNKKTYHKYTTKKKTRINNIKANTEK